MRDSTPIDLSSLLTPGAAPTPVQPAPKDTPSGKFAHLGGIERLPARSFDDEPVVDFTDAYGATGRQVFPVVVDSTPVAPQPTNIEPAESILRAAEGIDDDTRADLYDHFHESKNAAELTDRLTPLAVPDQLKNELWKAKHAQDAAAVADLTHADKVINAVKTVAAMDKATLDTAEKYPNVLRAIISGKD